MGIALAGAGLAGFVFVYVFASYLDRPAVADRANVPPLSEPDVFAPPKMDSTDRYKVACPDGYRPRERVDPYDDTDGFEMGDPKAYPARQP